MNVDALITAVRTRLLSDTATGGLMATGSELITNVYGFAAPGNASYQTKPYLLVDIAGTIANDAFDLDLVEFRFRVHCFSLANGGLTPVDAIMRRVYGQASRTPTYGLHRHALSLAGGSGWTATTCQFAGTNDGGSDEDHYHVVHDYVTNLQRAST